MPRLVAVRPTRVGEVSAKQVTGFFLKHARERQLSDRQFRRIVDAVQLVLVDLAQVPVFSAPKLDDWRPAAPSRAGTVAWPPGCKLRTA